MYRFGLPSRRRNDHGHHPVTRDRRMRRKEDRDCDDYAHTASPDITEKDYTEKDYTEKEDLTECSTSASASGYEPGANLGMGRAPAKVAPSTNQSRVNGDQNKEAAAYKDDSSSCNQHNTTPSVASRYGSRTLPPPPSPSFEQTYNRPDGKQATLVAQSQDTMIEIMPGIRARLRGSEETWHAIAKDFYSPCECFNCQDTIFCILDAEFVICPMCKTVSPLEGWNSGGGVGLGFTMDELARWQNDIVRERVRAQKTLMR